MEWTYVAGQTPLDPDEALGLIPEHITTQAQLNEWEQFNFFQGRRWALRAAGKAKLLDEGFVRELHRRMFNRTWKWAGTYRTSDKSIGSPWEQIGVRLNQLLGNVAWQIEHQSAPPDDIAVQFHRNLVWIHPFPNGNGRHARLLTDLLAVQLGRDPFTWGAADLVTQGPVRASYIAALQAADQGRYEPLLAFARS